MKRLVISCVATVLVFATTLAAAAIPDDSTPHGLLPTWAVPTHYQLDLRIDPRESDYSGVATIRIELKQPADHVWLHGKDLRVDKITVTEASGKSLKGKYIDVDPKAGVVRIDFGHTLEAQTLNTRIEFSAPFNQQLQGLYKVSRAGRDYAMTQFEAISARFAFPGFDQPDYKTPFDISMTIPDTDVAVANSGLSKTVEGKDGWKTLTFETTKPLPTYLVAYAVGPWDIVDGPSIPANQWRSEPVPLRGIAPKGEGSRMQRALEQTPAIIEYLENYYAFGYPFGKLDQLAAPDFAAGAMENAGLVTYRDWLMLLDDDSPMSNVRGSFNVAAHELAHQWTGDTVTMKWWDDIWLNEAFATWMQKKIAEKLHPEYHADLDRVQGAEGAMSSDSLVSARKIRQPITGNGDIQTAFDGITYQKGAAVLSMFEGFVGDEVFRKGMRAYIREHQFGNATADDLVAAVAKAADKGEDFTKAFDSFLDQSGVPQVATRLDCSATQPQLKLTQSRYLPLGSTGSTDRVWGIPMCVRTPAGTSCHLLDSKTGSMPLAGDTCPAWYMPNAGARGYYRFSMSHEDFAKLTQVLNSQLNDAEKLAYADAVDAGFRRGDLDAHEALLAMQQLAPAKTTDVALAPLGTVGWIWSREADTDAQKAHIRAAVKAAYLSRLEALGYTRKVGETASDVEMRGRLTGTLALTYKVPEVRAALLKQGDAVLASKVDGHLNYAAANPDLLGEALGVAVETHGKPTIDTLIAELSHTTDPVHRNGILSGLARAEDKQAERVRNLAISKEVKVGEMARLLYVDRETTAGRAAMWHWFVDNYDAIFKRIGAFASGYVPGLAGGGGCSDAEAERLQTFFNPRIKDLPGADRGLAQTTESIRLCAALKKAQNPAAIMR